MKKEKIVDNSNTEENQAPEEDVDTLENEEDTIEESAEEAVDFSQEIEKLKAENLALKNEFLRAYADAENTKKRCTQEIEKNTKYAISSFAKDLLSVADNLHRAIEALPEAEKAKCEEAKNLLKGVELTEAELMKVFNKFGIQKVDSMGKVFDPNYQRVIQEVEDKDKPAGTIIAELQTGYMINDRILREAMVVVTKSGK
jgi:molecular chaperone GrpE